jgi:hypothetical protein
MTRTRWLLTVLFVLAVLMLCLFYFVRPATGLALAALAGG